MFPGAVVRAVGFFGYHPVAEAVLTGCRDGYGCKGSFILAVFIGEQLATVAAGIVLYVASVNAGRGLCSVLTDFVACDVAVFMTAHCADCLFGAGRLAAAMFLIAEHYVAGFAACADIPVGCFIVAVAPADVWLAEPERVGCDVHQSLGVEVVIKCGRV